jgi:hypothetical protein
LKHEWNRFQKSSKAYFLKWLRMGHSRKHPYHPHRGNRKLTPFRCPNTFTIIRNNFFFPPPPDGRNFLCEGSMDLFCNDPIHFPYEWEFLSAACEDAYYHLFSLPLHSTEMEKQRPDFEPSNFVI